MMPLGAEALLAFHDLSFLLYPQYTMRVRQFLLADDHGLTVPTVRPKPVVDPVTKDGNDHADLKVTHADSGLCFCVHVLIIAWGSDRTSPWNVYESDIFKRSWKKFYLLCPFSPGVLAIASSEQAPSSQ
jgi:hypothetical protein